MTTLTETEVEACIADWLNGDEAAFKPVFRHYYRRLLSFALRFWPNRQQAEEVTMDVLLKFWRKKDSIQGALLFRSYIFVILRNELVSLHRKQVPALVAFDDINNELCDNGQEEHRNLQETLSQYAACIARLSPKRQEVFLLSREQGLTHAEIAEKLGLSVFTVKNHIKAALQQLRQELSGHGTLTLLYGTFLLDILHHASCAECSMLI